MGRKKGNKKQTPKEQGQPSEQTPPTPQDPQPSTSTFSASDVKNQKSSKSTGDDHQHKTEEWTTTSSRGKKTPISQDQRSGQPSGTGTSEGTQSVTESSQFKSEDRYYQRGKKTEEQKEQPARGGQHQKPRRQQPGRTQEWHDKGQPRKTGEEEWHSRGQDQNITRQQEPNREQQQRRSKPQQTRGQQGHSERKPFKGDFRSTEKQNQPHEGQGYREGNVWFKHAPQSPRKAEEAPNVWRNTQILRKEDGKGEQRSEVAAGAPDKVQPPSSSSTQEPIMELAPVFKDPGTLARKRIRVQSNHFALDLGKLKKAYQYDVEIKEFAENKEKQSGKQDKSKEKNNGNKKEGRSRKIKDKVNYKVLNEFLAKHFPDRNPSFDGQKNLYTSKLLTNNENDVLIDTGIIVEDDLGRQKTFSIEIKNPKELSLVPEPQAGTTHPLMLTKSAIQCIDIVLRNAPLQYFTQIGASFFRKPEQQKTIDLGGGMEMYYGFYQSVILGGRPLLNVHLAHKAFAKNIPVLDAFVEILDSKDTKRQRHTYGDIVSLQRWQVEALNSYIKSLKVAYEVPGSTKVVYRVNALAGSPKMEKFSHNGVEKTILEYFSSEKKYNIKNPDVPLLWVGSQSKRILVPPELCRIEKDQSVNKKLDDFYTRNMIKEAATDTHRHRENTINRFQDARYNQSPCIKEFEFRVNDKFEEMDARILPTPELAYREEGIATVSKGTWQMKQFRLAKAIKKWSIVDISGDRWMNRAKLDTFVTELKRAAKMCGINIESEPDFHSVKGPRNSAPAKPDLEQYFKDQKTKNYDITFVIIPNSNQAVYSYVKGAAEIAAGYLTQCVTAKTVTGRFSGPTATNILLKVNGKLDGINHSFTLQSKPLVLQKYEPVMFIGADVTHPGRAVGVPSIAAVTASHDRTAFQYNLRVRLQDSNVEDIIDLKNIVKEQLLFFYRKNRSIKPKAIIYFRDGVSEGQFLKVLDKELRAIKDACKEIQADGYDPAITVLVVQKRHHTRLFPVNNRDSEDQSYKRYDRNQGCEVTVQGNYNVPAGTCVDTHIVNPTMQNFYLVSHASIKGVARPTKYVTLYDDLDLSNDEIEELSYYLCHMFARCNRSVSYPAPTYYAHLGALRGKAYITPDLISQKFDIDNLQKEMDKIKIQDCILSNNPMFFI